MTIRSTILGRMRLPHRPEVAALAALAVILTACGTEDAPGPLEPSCEQQGRVRFVNLITDPARSPVNAILEGVPFGVNLGYTATTPASLPAPSTALYSAVCTGDRTIVLQHTPNPSVTHATLNFTIGEGQDRTVYAIGGAGATVITGFATTDDNAAPAAGQTRVRIVNMSPTAGAIDVFLTTAGADLATATPNATNLAYQAASAYVNVAPGTYTFRAVPAGTAPASRAASVTITQAGIVLSGGTGRSVVTADNNVGGTPLRAFVLSDR
ncbi:MAG: DUF4397 domain-containing protein [Gemmatimonadota bacterium]|nr:DUF4397 domain-containing protein [Gemmatimonadota bacterium]